MQRLLHDGKYKGVIPMLQVLGCFARRQYDDIPYVVRPSDLSDIEASSIVVVPIPLTKTKRRHRGYNHAEIIAQSLKKYFYWEVDTGLLARTKKTISQTKLTKEERRENVQNAFMIKNEIREKTRYVIVDDVVTTGATIAEAAKTLRQAGARHVSAFIIARG